jgi:hypothetical protein
MRDWNFQKTSCIIETTGEVQVNLIKTQPIIFMKKIFALSLCFIFLFAACVAQENPTAEGVQTPSSEKVETPESTSIEGVPTPTEESVTVEPTNQIEEVVPLPPIETLGPDCYGPEPNEIGKGIADKFDDTTYEQVMIWFCNGAEFEDILVALQTEKLTDVPAEEMLVMLADDWTWDEIWQLIGLTEE